MARFLSRKPGLGEVLFVGERTPGQEIVGELLWLGADRLEQHHELVEMIEVVACDQRCLVDVGAGNVRPEMADHRQAKGRDDIFSAYVSSACMDRRFLFSEHRYHI